MTTVEPSPAGEIRDAVDGLDTTLKSVSTSVCWFWSTLPHWILVFRINSVTSLWN